MGRLQGCVDRSGLVAGPEPDPVIVVLRVGFRFLMEMTREPGARCPVVSRPACQGRCWLPGTRPVLPLPGVSLLGATPAGE